MKRRAFLRGLLGFPLLGFLRPGAARVEIDSTFRLAFGSCCEQDREQRLWPVIFRERPNVFAFLGDNIYADTRDMAEMAAKYRKLGTQAGFQKFRERVPIIATWDDHDYGENDAGFEYPHKHQSKDIFLDFFGEPANSPRRTREGVYTSYYFGAAPRRVQVILLDMRWFRGPLVGEPDLAYEPNPDPNAVLLGEEQWAWLERELRRPADFRIIASSVQLVSAEHAWEKWANFPYEKARLMALIDKLALRDFVVISGDMHFGELSFERTPGGRDVYDLTSSGLNVFESAELIYNSRRMAIFDSGINFGMVTVDWDRRVARLEVRDGRSQIVIAHDVILDR